MRFLVQLSEDRSNPQWDQVLTYILRALTLANVDFLRANPSTPRMYDSGMVYRPDGIGDQAWLDVGAALERGWADCKTVSAIRAAELQVAGEEAWPIVGRRRVMDVPTVGRVNVIHIQVRRRDGRVEDPSAILIDRENARR